VLAAYLLLLATGTLYNAALLRLLWVLEKVESFTKARVIVIHIVREVDAVVDKLLVPCFHFENVLDSSIPEFHILKYNLGVLSF